MARFPQSYSINAPFVPSSSPSPTHIRNPGYDFMEAGKNPAVESVEKLVFDICDPRLRENALLQLSKRREIFKDLAPLLWYSFGTMTILLQEIISVYPFLSPPSLAPNLSNRVCNALALLQCIASHRETRIPFLNSHFPLYLYPFLNTTSNTRPFEFLRLTSLGVIGALVKTDETEIISFLLQTEIIPLCLRNMENGNELSKTVATFIVQKIILHEVGLYYVCSAADRFDCVTQVLGTMIESLTEQPSSRLLKHIIRCFLRFSEDRRYYTWIALREKLPMRLKDGTFDNFINSDPLTKVWLQQLLFNLYGDARAGGLLQQGFAQ